LHWKYSIGPFAAAIRNVAPSARLAESGFPAVGLGAGRRAGRHHVERVWTSTRIHPSRGSMPRHASHRRPTLGRHLAIAAPGSESSHA